MFNEAFWFFYLVNVAESFTFLCSTAVIVGLISTVAVLMFTTIEVYDEADQARGFRLAKWILIGVAGAFIIGTLIPSKNALYAGAGRYVAESIEVDETLLRLKTVIDKKIEEM